MVEELSRIVEVIKEEYDPERIIVFGSMAENNIHESREDRSQPLTADQGSCVIRWAVSILEDLMHMIGYQPARSGGDQHRGSARPAKRCPFQWARFSATLGVKMIQMKPTIPRDGGKEVIS